MCTTTQATQLALNVLEMVIQLRSLQIYPNYYRKNKMPWTSKQHKLFEAAAHSPQVAKRVGIPVEKAKQMASEGIKHNPKQLAKALMRK